MSRKVVGVDEPVPVRLSLRQRELILDHTFAGPELADRLRVVEAKNRLITAHFTLSEIDELAGFVAAEANHSGERRMMNPNIAGVGNSASVFKRSRFQPLAS